MAGKLEDDYWNSTSGFSFKFDDEGEFAKDSNNDLFTEHDAPIFNSTLELYNLFPIHLLISPNNLDVVLDDIKSPILNAIKSIEYTIDEMCLDKYCNLNGYRSLDQKISLLDKAIETSDGNVILKIILFLAQTLKTNILYRYLSCSSRHLALQQYTNYLAEIQNLQELELLYASTKTKSEIGNLFYLSTQTTLNNINTKLDQFIPKYSNNTNYNVFRMSSNNFSYDKMILLENRKFQEIRMDRKLISTTVIMALGELYKRKIILNQSINDAECSEFVKLLKISDFQNEWILLNCIASEGAWTKINNIFVKLNWFTKKSVIKSSIDTELLVNSMHKHEVPQKSIEEFLTNMDDVEKSLYLARKFKYHKFVIDVLISQKDKQRLMEYKKYISQTDDAILIDNALLG